MQWAVRVKVNRTETVNLAVQFPERVEALARIWEARWGKPKWEVERRSDTTPKGPLKWIADQDEKPLGHFIAGLHDARAVISE